MSRQAGTHKGCPYECIFTCNLADVGGGGHPQGTPLRMYYSRQSFGCRARRAPTRGDPTDAYSRQLCRCRDRRAPTRGAPTFGTITRRWSEIAIFVLNSSDKNRFAMFFEFACTSPPHSPTTDRDGVGAPLVGALASRSATIVPAAGTTRLRLKNATMTDYSMH